MNCDKVCTSGVICDDESTGGEEGAANVRCVGVGVSSDKSINDIEVEASSIVGGADPGRASSRSLRCKASGDLPRFTGSLGGEIGAVVSVLLKGRNGRLLGGEVAIGGLIGASSAIL